MKYTSVYSTHSTHILYIAQSVPNQLIMYIFFFRPFFSLDDNHLFIRQGTGLQGQAVFRTKLSFRPSSTDSFTHQKMTRSMADRTNKATGIKVISTVGRDPEAGRFKRVKEEEERLRMDLRRDSMKKRVKERATANRLSQGYLEGGDSDDEGGVSLNALKNKYKKGGNKRGGKNKEMYLNFSLMMVLSIMI